MRWILTIGFSLVSLLEISGCAKLDESAVATNKLCTSDKSCPSTLTCGKGQSDRAQCVQPCARVALHVKLDFFAFPRL